MSPAKNWDPCVAYEGPRAEAFIADYFASKTRQVLMVVGAGFDYRSSRALGMLSKVAKDRLTGLFIREQRPEPGERLIKLADANEAQLRQCCADATVVSVDVFDSRDSAVVVGPQVVKVVGQDLTLDKVTDVVVDMSAMSIGLSFPLVRLVYQRARQSAARGHRVNVHVLLMSDGFSDESVEREFIDKVTTVHGFAGQLGLRARREQIARLWIPQLSNRKRAATRLIFQYLLERAPMLDVCPLIPFPSWA